MGEEWRVIKEFPRYEVSSLGNVRNIETGKILKPQHNKRGGNYPYVDLRYNGQRDCVNIHNLVAENFLGPRPPDTEIHHKDTNRDNPAESNLEYLPETIHKRNHIEDRRKKAATYKYPLANLAKLTPIS